MKFQNFGYDKFDSFNEPVSREVYCPKATSLDGYAPKNKKLLTFPYCYILLSNNNGSSNLLQYEKFKGQNCHFTIYGIPTTNGSIKCVPNSYSYDSEAIEEEGIVAGKFPTFNWSKENYSDWLLTNSASLNVQKSYGEAFGKSGVVGLGLSAIGILASGSYMGLAGLMGAGISMGHGYQQMEMAIANDEDHKKIPDSAVGLASAGDINFANKKAGFFFYYYSIKREFAKTIDEYFSMFGYRVNSMEIPNLHTRVNWNYLKLISPNVESEDVPEKDMNVYKQMLENGITFWHNPNTFRDYSQDNYNS